MKKTIVSKNAEILQGNQPYLNVLKKKYSTKSEENSKPKPRQKSVIEPPKMMHSVDEKDADENIERELENQKRIMTLEAEVKRLKESERKLMEDLVHQQQITKETLLSLKQEVSEKQNNEKKFTQDALEHEKEKFTVFLKINNKNR